MQPPYWRMMHLALRIEMARRGLDLESAIIEPAMASEPEGPIGTAAS